MLVASSLFSIGGGVAAQDPSMGQIEAGIFNGSSRKMGVWPRTKQQGGCLTGTKQVVGSMAKYENVKDMNITLRSI